MSKWEKYSKEELQEICDNSKTYREIAKKIGYYIGNGNYIHYIKRMIEELELELNVDFDNSNYFEKDKKRIDTQDYLNNKIKISSYKLKLRLIEEHILPKKCNKCNLENWLEQDIPLHLHHIDGNNENNQLLNLELLCPNCHALTKNYCGLNKKNKKTHIVSDKDFIEALINSKNIRQALIKLELASCGANYKRANKLLSNLMEQEINILP